MLHVEPQHRRRGLPTAVISVVQGFYVTKECTDTVTSIVPIWPQYCYIRNVDSLWRKEVT